ncbi:hypothetical protein BC628DRAFT_911169 [Trametes gibbosa]|nr:hypothetical protein BC628DRAFT_911169 [Trametes gibbosa]
MGDLSLRHLPDLSDFSASADLSDASFQIPRAANTADDLLADDPMDFFANDALATPAAPPRSPAQPPLTLADLTPRSKPVRSSLRPRPGITTPYKAIVASGLSVALSEDISPCHQQDPSFQIPSYSENGDDLLVADDGQIFFQDGPSLDVLPTRAHGPLTLSQLSPAPRFMPPLPSASHSGPLLRSPNVQSPTFAAHDNMQVENEPDNIAPELHAMSSAVIHNIPTIAAAVDTTCSTVSSLGQSAEKGIVKAHPTCHAERKKKLTGGDKAKRKKVTPAAAITKPAKLKSSTVSLARRISMGGKTSVRGMRHKPLLAPSTTILTDVKPARTGGLADMLLSFGQKLIASAVGPDHNRAADAVTGIANSAVLGEDDPASIAPNRHSGVKPDADEGRDLRAVFGPSYSASPREPGDYNASSATLASGSGIAAGAPTDDLDQRATEPQVEQTECLLPMRRSIKRAGSPAREPPAQQRKRPKTTSGHPAPPSKESAPRKPTLQPSRSKNAPAPASSTNAARARRIASASASSTNLYTKAKVAQKPDAAAPMSLSLSGPDMKGIGAQARGPVRGKIPDGDSGAHAVLSKSGGGRSGDASRSQKENLADTEERQPPEHRDGQTSRDRPMRAVTSVDRPPTILPSAKPTRPLEFRFATSTRLEARKAELEKSASGSSMGTSTNSHAMSLRRSKAHTAAHPIPDFKALHALQESMLAQRRAEITPVVPLPIELSTEARSHERERYEEARHAREAELEKQREERRRQQELEEEQEIKELRRRAVPKANEVPEWYAFAPKKSKADIGN